MPDVYVFTSANLTNLWAGVGAGYWAVSAKQAGNSSIRGKAKSLPTGAFGLFYCVEAKALTTPFIVTSKPNDNVIIRHVWEHEWHLPFTIVPLSDPRLILRIDELGTLLPSLRGASKTWNDLFHISPITVFAPSKLSEKDWEIIIGILLPKTSFDSTKT
ncbi:hypothetical protein FJ930_07220 [Mesorhizobium sp. B2-4-15]|uniref:hypothetical protein n=1 Tax=Mesorhizobium sp. B2-4-15 TaxID=2589934 RepID=UPI00114FB83B|nr:hypothetical protein [Mesorhizobium sp. B2-4-15]TPK74784.1 hypothetical protein FJ930_07220 [Mesorhizobium sp. B2-4-15]